MYRAAAAPVRPTGASPSASTGGRTPDLGTPNASFKVGLSAAPNKRRAGLPPVVEAGILLAAAVIWTGNAIALMGLVS